MSTYAMANLLVPVYESLMATDMPVWYIITFRACLTRYLDDESSRGLIYPVDGLKEGCSGESCTALTAFLHDRPSYKTMFGEEIRGAANRSCLGPLHIESDGG